MVEQDYDWLRGAAARAAGGTLDGRMDMGTAETLAEQYHEHMADHGPTGVEVVQHLIDAEASFFRDPTTHEWMCSLGDGDVHHGRDGWESLLMAIAPVSD